MKSLIAFCCIVYLHTCCAAQADTLKSVLQLGMTGHAGKLIKIHGEYPENDVSSVTELSLLWKTTGRSSWHNHYRYPSAGFSFVHTQFGNQDVLGNAFALIPQMRFERWRKNTRFSWRAGLGIAWFDKPYDARENPRNLVIGSSLANMSMAAVEMSRPLGKNLMYSFGLSFFHCSNSHVAVPNIGANIIAVNAGLSLCNQPKTLKKSPDFRGLGPPMVKTIGMHGILGLHELPGTIRPSDGIRYPVYGLSVFVTKGLAFRKISLGVNYHYFPAYYDYIVSQELFRAGTNASKKSHSVVLFAGHEWRFNRFALFIQAGVNVYHPFIHQLNKVWDLPKSSFLNLWTGNKIGYRYYMRPANMRVVPFIHVAVKANGGTADFFETGIGFVIK